MRKITLLLLSLGLLSTMSLKASITEPVVKSKADSSVIKEMMLDDVVATDALREFRSLSRVEKKMRMAEVKKVLKEYKAAKKAGTAAAEPSTSTILLVILAILLPPLAVYLHEGTINGKFWLSLLLTLLFWLPGVIYALFVVLT